MQITKARPVSELEPFSASITPSRAISLIGLLVTFVGCNAQAGGLACFSLVGPKERQERSLIGSQSLFNSTLVAAAGRPIEIQGHVAARRLSAELISQSAVALLTQATAGSSQGGIANRSLEVAIGKIQSLLESNRFTKSQLDDLIAERDRARELVKRSIEDLLKLAPQFRTHLGALQLAANDRLSLIEALNYELNRNSLSSAERSAIANDILPSEGQASDLLVRQIQGLILAEEATAQRLKLDNALLETAREQDTALALNGRRPSIEVSQEKLLSSGVDAYLLQLKENAQTCVTKFLCPGNPVYVLLNQKREYHAHPEGDRYTSGTLAEVNLVRQSVDLRGLNRILRKTQAFDQIFATHPDLTYRGMKPGMKIHNEFQDTRIVGISPAGMILVRDQPTTGVSIRSRLRSQVRARYAWVNPSAFFFGADRPFLNDYVFAKNGFRIGDEIEVSGGTRVRVIGYRHALSNINVQTLNPYAHRFEWDMPRSSGPSILVERVSGNRERIVLDAK